VRPWLALLGLLLAAGPAAGQVPDNLPALRALALSAVNADRVQHGLAPLRLSDALNRAAQAHAGDMLQRGYFDHFSPEGRSVDDRFQEQGGSPSSLAAENLSMCTGCPAAVPAERVRLLEQGWMDSPDHRDNILRRGLTGFGFGFILAEGGVHYAVQTFAGPGVPQDSGADEPAQVLSAPEQVDVLLRQVNTARAGAGLSALQADAELTALARSMVSNDPDAIVSPDKMQRFDALAGEGRWQETRVASMRCGGCGARPTAADIAYFAGEFLGQGDLLAVALDSAGFAMTVDGQGMKSAVLLLGRR
jgi:uncharacterized protein YkwD